MRVSAADINNPHPKCESTIWLMFFISVLRSKYQHRNRFRQDNESITFNDSEADGLFKQASESCAFEKTII
ncbi:MAG: hypothetical protein QOH96_191 [Blastocatellia bacterium]|jgi:hypothetical protein|nr:hypothetical protein [Blastocatellia bacterium]